MRDSSWESEETKVYIESFIDFEDAATWLSRHIEEVPDDMFIFNAGINLVDVKGVEKWRAGISFGNQQLKLFEDEGEE